MTDGIEFKAAKPGEREANEEAILAAEAAEDERLGICRGSCGA